MKLKKILENLHGVKKIEGRVSLEIKGIACDSKAVKDSYLFVALRGSRFNGADFIDEAIDRGAVAVMLEFDANRAFTFKRGVTFIYVDDARAMLSEASRTFYGDISRKMLLVGVTGTNGKTTITYLLESLFKKKGEKTGVIGTVNYRFENRLIPAINTTPGILDLYSLFTNMHKRGVKNCILEVSSHSLELGRVDTLNFDMAIFTNLTNEHLDFHKDMENYLASKMRLFAKIKQGGCAIINIDDPNSGKIIKKIRLEKKADLITYGIDNAADVRATDVECSFEGLRFELSVRGLTSNIRMFEVKPRTGRIESRLIGRHNAYNILASAACGMAMGMKLEEIASVMKEFPGLPGRLEKIDCGQDFLVFVDYAHTENGLENVLKALRELNPGKLLVVFGCGGDRDRSKRPKMGGISAGLSDRVFITSDNPRSEIPSKIIKEIASGIPAGKNNYVIEEDRFKAIVLALREAKKGDIVLVAGKGHETYQIFKEVTVPFDDREVVRRALNLQKQDSYKP